MSEFDSDGIIIGTIIIVVTAILTMGLTTCSEHEAAFKKQCLEMGGTVIPVSPSQSRCENPRGRASDDAR